MYKEVIWTPDVDILDAIDLEKILINRKLLVPNVFYFRNGNIEPVVHSVTY